jgi:diguanylate cyclase (GGDEF)-like protein
MVKENVQTSKIDSFPILIVEDDPVARKRLKITLLKAGHTVTSVENGRQALELYEKEFFPIVLTDWIMPEMDGLELCRCLRTNNFPGYVYIIILTAKDSKESIISGLDAGADDYITKPFHSAELQVRLKTAIRILEMEKDFKLVNEKIRTLSITDPLTGCYNRAYISERLPKEIKKARRYQHPLSVVMCDLDHFKQVNDEYGHHIGDCLIKEFVNSTLESIRDDTDWLARYGGEEFLIVVPETDYRGAYIMAERLRTEICRESVKIEQHQILYTVSFGISGFLPSMKNPEISPDMMIGKADEYLYQCKQQGRNLVIAGGL